MVSTSPSERYGPVENKTNVPPKNHRTRVYAPGVFDLFHRGHWQFLEQAKKAFPDTHLVVGVSGYKKTLEKKGKTVMTAAEREAMVKCCPFVDEIIPDCPPVLTNEFLDKHKIDYVARDDEPLPEGKKDVYAFIKQQGRYLVTQRTEGISTTDLVSRIIRNRDEYIVRQLKRGATRQEMGISWLQQFVIQVRVWFNHRIKATPSS